MKIQVNIISIIFKTVFISSLGSIKGLSIANKQHEKRMQSIKKNSNLLLFEKKTHNLLNLCVGLNKNNESPSIYDLKTEEFIENTYRKR